MNEREKKTIMTHTTNQKVLKLKVKTWIQVVVNLNGATQVGKKISNNKLTRGGGKLKTFT